MNLDNATIAQVTRHALLDFQGLLETLDTNLLNANLNARQSIDELIALHCLATHQQPETLLRDLYPFAADPEYRQKAIAIEQLLLTSTTEQSYLDFSYLGFQTTAVVDKMLYLVETTEDNQQSDIRFWAATLCYASGTAGIFLNAHDAAQLEGDDPASLALVEIATHALAAGLLEICFSNE